MWEINNTIQAVDFFRAIFLGIIICIIYAFFYAIRKIGLSSAVSLIFEDIIFVLIISPLIFLFLLATTNGEIRLYIGIGIIFGFYICKITLFKIFAFIIIKILIFIEKIFEFSKRLLIKFIIIFTFFSHKVIKKLVFLKKGLNCLKKGLKKS